MEVGSSKGVGFLDPKTGALRSKSELSSLDNSEKSNNSSQSASSSAETGPSVGRAFAAVRSRSSSQINQFAGVLNQNIDNLKSAKDNLQSRRDVARDLKVAIKDGDEESATKLRSEFEALQTEQDSIAGKVEQDNKNSSENRIQSFRLGNKTLGTLQTDAVKVSSATAVDTSSVDGLNEFLDSSETELTSINEQIEANRSTRKEARELNRNIRQEINTLESNSETRVSNSISSLEEAGVVAQSVAVQIGSQATLEQSILNSVDSDTLSSLLEGS